MRRREFITVFGGAAFIIPLAAPAQPMKAAKIGFLGVATASGFASKVEGFRAGLRDLDYVEGKISSSSFDGRKGDMSVCLHSRKNSFGLRSMCS